MQENIGLVLEGGGMRGVFTAGILDFFLEKDIYFKDCIAVSAGATHGCSYMCRQKGRSIEITQKFLYDKRYCSMQSLITTGDLFGAKLLYEEIPQKLYPVDDDTYAKTGGRLYTVVTNCKTGKAEYLLVKNMIRDCNYIRASASLPGLARMVELNNNLYLDGGMVDSIPIKKSVELGNNKNVVVLTQPRDFIKEQTGNLWFFKMKYRKFPNLYKAIETRHIEYNKTLKYIFNEEKLGNIFVICPTQSLGLGRTEKNLEKLNQTYDKGVKIAEDIYPNLLEFLNSK